MVMGGCCVEEEGCKEEGCGRELIKCQRLSESEPDVDQMESEGRKRCESQVFRRSDFQLDEICK